MSASQASCGDNRVRNNQKLMGEEEDTWQHTKEQMIYWWQAATTDNIYNWWELSMCIVSVAREATANKKFINRDKYNGEALTRQEQKNKRESKPTQYLTKFDNLPTSSGQGRDVLLIQQSIQPIK